MDNNLLPSKTTFLAIPIKEPDLRVDWTDTLTTILSNSEVINPDDFKIPIASLNNLRIKSKDSIESCIRYFGQLEIIASKFNITNQMEFIWSDAFNHHKTATQKSIAYEKANILFNLGALYSQANGLKKTKEESLKYAGIVFQQAASVFHHISHNFINPPLRDLSPKILEFLHKFMLSQAQECCLLKSMVDGVTKLDSRSKIAAGAYKLYSEAYNCIKGRDDSNNSNNGNNQNDNIDSDFDNSDNDNDNLIAINDLQTWISTTQNKCLMMKAMVNWFEGELALEGSSPRQGEGIARLQEAIKYFSKSSSFNSHSNSNSHSDNGEWESKIKDHLSTKLKKAINENNVIFCHPIPPLNELKPVAPVIIVKIIELTSLVGTRNERDPEEDLFASFIPIRVFEEVSKYSEEKSKLVRYETLKVNNSDGELQSILCSLGFPQSLDNYESALKLGIPDAIISLRPQYRERIREGDGEREDRGDKERERVLKVGGNSYLDMWNTFKAIFDDLFLKLRGLETGLSNEIKAYQSALIDYGDRWSGIEPSHKENDLYFHRLKDYNNTLNYMKKSLEMDIGSFERSYSKEFHVLFDKDEKSVRRCLREMGFNLFSLSPSSPSLIDNNDDNERSGHIGNHNNNNDNHNNNDNQKQIKKMVQEIRGKLSLIDDLVRNRTIKLDSLKKFILKDDIGQKLAIVKPSMTCKLIDEELKKFDEPCKQIEENCERQSILLQEISTMWNKRVQLSSQNGNDNTSGNGNGNGNRDGIAKIQECYNVHRELVDKFMTFLQSKPFMTLQENIEELTVKIESWITERMKKMQDLQYKLDNIKAEGTHKMLLDKLSRLKNSKTTLSASSSSIQDEMIREGEREKEKEKNKREGKEEKDSSKSIEQEKDEKLDQEQINNLLQRKLSHLDIKKNQVINNGESLLD